MRKASPMVAAILLLVPFVPFAAGRGETPAAGGQQAFGPAEQSSLDGLVPMDDDTAAILWTMGVAPFPDKIPSEDFSLDTLGGGQAHLVDYLGKIVFLNFWATWCSPCREEMPSMQLLYNELSDEGLEILAVDFQEGESVVAEFVEEFKFTYPILLDRDGRVMTRYGIRAFPTTYIIDRAGYILGVRMGYHDWSSDDIVEGFRQLLSAE